MSDDATGEALPDGLAVVRGMKLAFVGHPERANDLNPALIASRRGEMIAMCDLGDVWADRHNVLRGMVAVLDPDDVVLVVESLVLLEPDEVSGDRVLSERFRDGDPSVSRAIDVLQMTSSGEVTQVFLPYRCEGGALTWREPQQVKPLGEPARTSKSEGEIVDALRAGFAAAGGAYDAKRAHDALDALGVRLRLAEDPNPFVGVAPEEPCPCGSNRMLQDCHDAYQRTVVEDELPHDQVPGARRSLNH